LASRSAIAARAVAAGGFGGPQGSKASPRRKLSLGHVFPIAFPMLSRREHFKENFHAARASDSSNSPEALRESENTNNLFHQNEISLILLPVAEPETDRVRMLREQGRIYRSVDVSFGSEGSEIFLLQTAVTH
jgi:hypothetical protein